MALSRRPDLQQGTRPRQAKGIENPDEALRPAAYRRADAGGAAGAMPAETFQYNIVYETFKNDSDFWTNWNVVDCARNSPLESISQENASIRVVMKLDSNQKLVPTAYTPGFPTVPYRAAGYDPGVRREKEIPGLPPGYSVALDVYILSDARIMLQHQRDFRGGTVDPEYAWLEKIVDAADKQDGIDSRAPRKPAHDGPSLVSKAERNRPEAKLRPPIGGLPADCGVKGLSDALTPYSDDLSDRAGVLPHVALGWNQVYQEMTLVSAFDNSRLGLPPRDNGTWASKPKRTHDDEAREQDLEARQNAALAEILERTAALDR